MKSIRATLSIALLMSGCAAVALVPLRAEAFETKAQYAYMEDFETGQVLLSKDSDVKMHPSSMSKLMTVYIVFKNLKDGKIKLTDTYRVSEKAWRTQGSKMFVHVGDQVPLEDLMHGIITQSGNDSCIVVAEGISGSEEAFAELMTRTAKELGMENSNFVNATGWPDEGQMMSSRDLAILSRHIIQEFPEYYSYFSLPEFTYNKIRQPNRNRLLGNDIGVDGLKTGHTEIAGYGITLSAKDPQSGRRVILVVNGLKSDNERVEEGDRILRWGLRAFENRAVAKAGENVAEAAVWFGKKQTVTLTPEHDLVLTLPEGDKDKTKYVLRYNSPVPAPIQKGDKIAELEVRVPSSPPRVIPLVAAEDVGKLSGFSKIWATLKYLVLESRQKPEHVEEDVKKHEEAKHSKGKEDASVKSQDQAPAKTEEKKPEGKKETPRASDE